MFEINVRMARESSVGIELFLSGKVPGFKGILKHKYVRAIWAKPIVFNYHHYRFISYLHACRCADFRVTEIDPLGQLALITNKEIPKNLVEGSDNVTFNSIEDVLKSYIDIIGHNNATRANELKAFLESLEDKGKKKESKSVTLDPCTDKVSRRRIHTMFANCTFLPRLFTSTLQEEGEERALRVCVTYDPSQQGTRRGKQDAQGPSKLRWEGGSNNKYLKFVLWKKNMETHAVLSNHKIHRHKKLFAAGTKDKRAITSQWITGYKLHPICLLEGASRMHGVDVGNFSYVSEHLHLGDLSGNHFEVILRGVEAHQDAIEESVRIVKENGFINYFGMQRFGNGKVPTHEIGRAMLQGDWEKAVEYILMPPTDSGFGRGLAEAYAIFKSKGDLKEALKKTPRCCTNQVKLLQVLARKSSLEPEACLSALLALPKTARLMYLNAFQSYIWNKAVSQRLKTKGSDKVVPGDLILTRKQLSESRTAFINKKREREDEGIEQHDVHIATDEDCRDGTYSMMDVVLPLPGNKVMYPSLESMTIYHQILSEIESNSSHSTPEFMLRSLSGTYRHLIHRVNDLSYRIFKYDDSQGEFQHPLPERMDGAHSIDHTCVCATNINKNASILQMENLPVWL